MWLVRENEVLLMRLVRETRCSFFSVVYEGMPRFAARASGWESVVMWRRSGHETCERAFPPRWSPEQNCKSDNIP